MQFDLIVAADLPRRTLRRDAIVALVLAAFLSFCWAVNDWRQIGHLILPDTDDMMRLAQVRDWLAGQRFDDWTQHRVAPPFGGPMHWSRINDFGIAGIIVGATPLVGRHTAELTAVILYPALLFACHICLSARIARRLWSAEVAPVAAVLAALAYPGTTLFAPGRIDHHALQVVVIESAVLALMRTSGWAGGAVAGLAVAVSLVIGLETAPQAAALTCVVAVLWMVRGMAERTRLTGFAVALGGTTMFSLFTLKPSYWTASFCDAFTPASSTGTLAVSGALAALALATPLLTGWKARGGAGLIVGGGTLAATLGAYPVCLTGPYGVMDPFLRRSYIVFINEANGLFSQSSVAMALSNVGLLVAGCVAAAWMVARRPRRWAIMLPIVAVLAMSMLVTLAQMRGVYIGAPVAAPVLAGLVLAARRRLSWRLPALIGAWVASAGIAYAKIPDLAARFSIGGQGIVRTPQGLCNVGDVWEQVDRYPPGVTMAATSIAPYVIGATHHSVVAAGYHRDNRGNMAMYRYFLSPPERGATIARSWNVRYVAVCPGDFSELAVTRAYPRSIAALLQTGRPPAGFERLPLHGTRLAFYRIAR